MNAEGAGQGWAGELRADSRNNRTKTTAKTEKINTKRQQQHRQRQSTTQGRRRRAAAQTQDRQDKEVARGRDSA
jgi:hypothetical protein